jgi:DNA-directed RNA polymerase subunit RPC12/RpoP
MAVYKCEACGMTIGTMTCGTCDKELEHGSITTDDGEPLDMTRLD